MRDEHVFDIVLHVDPWELQNLRRSLAMTPDGTTVGTLKKEEAEALVEEVLAGRSETARYRHAVAQLRSVLDTGPWRLSCHVFTEPFGMPGRILGQ